MEINTEQTVETLTGSALLLQRLANRMFRGPVRVLFSLLLVAAAAWAIHWNLTDRLELLESLIETERHEFALSSDLADLQSKLRRFDPQVLANEIEQEDRRVFDGFPQVAAWPTLLGHHAQARSLSLDYKLGEARQAIISEVLEVPVEFQFSTGTDGAAGNFDSVLQFVGVLLTDRWHLDIVSVDASGAGKGMDRLSMDATIWVHDWHGFSDARSAHIQARSSSPDIP